MKTTFGGRVKLSRAEAEALVAQLEMLQRAGAEIRAHAERNAAAIRDAAAGIAFASETLGKLAHGLEIGGEHADVRAGAVSSLRTASDSLAQVAADFRALAERMQLATPTTA